MRILIIDNQVLFRQGLKALLANEPGFTVVGEAGTATEALEKVTELKPELILLDLSLPDAGGLEFIKTILTLQPEIKIVILTSFADDDLLFAAFRYGVKGFLLKENSFSILVASIKALNRGELAVSRVMTARVLDEFARLSAVTSVDDGKFETLTPREIEVIRHLALKSTNQEIAEILSISESTVKLHIPHILKKLQLRNRNEVADFARRTKL